MLVVFVSYSDQLLTARSHVNNLKSLSSQLSELEDLFRSPSSGETWSVGTALGQVTSQLRSALSLFDALEIPADESRSVDDDENRKHIDDTCRDLRETIMLVIQTLYKRRDSNGEDPSEDRQVDSDEGSVDCIDIVDIEHTPV